MRQNKLLKTNLLISVILLVGFALTTIFGYRVNYTESLKHMEQVSSLTVEGIYHQISAMFTKPVNISLTMANDSLLANHLREERGHLEDEAYIRTTQDYLDGYRRKYQLDSVFLVSTASGRYYNFNGVDRILTEDNPENNWYFDLLDSDVEYSLQVDNDEVEGAENEITVFINCKILNPDGSAAGVVGVGIRIEQLKELLRGYEENYNISAFLIDGDGTIEISTTYNGHESVDWFETYEQQNIRRQILEWKDGTSNLEIWDKSEVQGKRSHIAAHYIPELSWWLLVEQNTGKLVREMRTQAFLTGAGIIIVILVVLAIITSVIRRFNNQITELIEERQAVFRKATENMYENIYELNLTKDCYVGKMTEEYFKSLGAEGLSYHEGLQVIAQKQVKEEFREGYISTFSPKNAIREFENGNNHLRYDFMLTQDGENYYWMRIDAYSFYSAEDQSVHMFAYRRNIDAEKKKERQAELDEMTGFYTKKATERMIQRLIQENPKQFYAFFILDIDNFKTANDQFGHDFGDFCIKRFTGIIRQHFGQDDILGRIGGDEFGVFIPIPDIRWAQAKAEELIDALDTVCEDQTFVWKMSTSIGIAVTSSEAADFETLYRNADKALYQTKDKGRNGFTIYGSAGR